MPYLRCNKFDVAHYERTKQYETPMGNYGVLVSNSHLSSHNHYFMQSVSHYTSGTVIMGQSHESFINMTETQLQRDN